MRTKIIEVSSRVTLATEECYKCGVVFAVPESFQNKRRQDGSEFFCPNGHGQVYTETEVMRLRAKLDQAEAAKERAEHKIERMKIRIHAGICPECHRHFDNVQRHMQSKHSP